MQVGSSGDPLLSPEVQIRCGNVQRKALFLPAYHCSISSSLLPEIDGERSRAKARDWKDINCFFAEDGDINIRHRWLAATTSWADLHLFLWQAKEGWRGEFGITLTPVVVLAEFHRLSVSFPMPIPFPGLSLFLCAILIPFSLGFFLLAGILSSLFLRHPLFFSQLSL